MKVIDPAQGANQANTPDAGKRFVGLVFTIKGVTGSPQGEDANNDAVLVGANGRDYPAALDRIAGYTNFDDGAIHVTPGQTGDRRGRLPGTGRQADLDGPVDCPQRLRPDGRVERAVLGRPRPAAAAAGPGRNRGPADRGLTGYRAAATSSRWGVGKPQTQAAARQFYRLCPRPSWGPAILAGALSGASSAFRLSG